MPLFYFAGVYHDLTASQRAALATLIAPRYVALSYPTPAAFATDQGVTPGTPAFTARWNDLVSQCRAAIATSSTAEDGISAIFATTSASDMVALATLQTVRGTSATPLAVAVGATASTLPTHRTLDFRYPPDIGLDPDEVPESALAEFSQLVVANPDQLRPLVAAGRLTPAEAAYVVRYGLSEVLVRSVRRDQPQAAPPLAYLFNTTPLLAHALRRKGLALKPLFLAGATPTPRLLAASHLGGVYFRRWPAALAPVVPPSVLSQGIAAAIRFLVDQGFRGWHRLAISLPYLLLNDARLTTAISRLERACRRVRDTLADASVAA